MTNIKKITALEAYAVRHPVLRNKKPISSCHFDGDDFETTNHFGCFLNNELIGILSLFKTNNPTFVEENQFQIRGMAVLNEHQKKGIGKLLVIYCEKQLPKNSLNWFNARKEAVGFYENLEYVKKGPFFEIKDIGGHTVMFKIKKKNE